LIDHVFVFVLFLFAVIAFSLAIQTKTSCQLNYS